MSEKSYRLRVWKVRKLKVDSKKTWKQIAKECSVHIGTLKRWLAGEEALMDNITALANAINTTPGEIILPKDQEEDLTDYVDAEMTAEGDPSDFEQPNDITAIIEEAQKKIGAKYKILLMYVGEGSVKIGIKLHASDAIRLAKAFIQGTLHDMKITAVLLASYVQQKKSVITFPCPRCHFMYSLDTRLRKQKIKCLNCWQKLQVP